MRSMRTPPHALVRAAAVFVLSAGVAAPALVTAPAAYAETATVTRTATLDDGRLDIGLPFNALWVKVNVLASTAPDAAVLASTDELSWHDYDWVTDKREGWATDAPIRLPEGTAYGTYPVSVEYRMPGGTVQRWTGGSFGYKLHTGVAKLSFDRRSVDYDHRDVVLSGTAVTYDPATGVRTAARAGTQVKVALDTSGQGVPNPSAVAVTGAGGAFSLPFTLGGSVYRGTASVVEPAADTDPDDAKFVPSLPVAPTQYRITASLDKHRVYYGTDVNVTGRVERLTTDGWKPFAGAPVVSTPQQPDTSGHTVDRLMGGTAAAADGTFAYPAKGTFSTQVFTHVRPSPFLAGAPYALGEIAVPQKFTFTNLAITLDPYGTVRATGRMTANWCGDDPLVLQYSLDGRTWKSLKWGKSEGGAAGYCPFDITSPGYVRAYYRVVHAETDQFVTVNSTPVFLTRVPTRFSGFRISPTRPNVNGSMTVSGAVQKYVGGVWKPAAGQYVTLYFKPRGESQWYWVKRNVKTAANGGFSFTATNYGDGHWGMATQPLTGYFYSETNAVYIDAR